MKTKNEIHNAWLMLDRVMESFGAPDHTGGSLPPEFYEEFSNRDYTNGLRRGLAWVLGDKEGAQETMEYMALMSLWLIESGLVWTGNRFVLPEGRNLGPFPQYTSLNEEGFIPEPKSEGEV